MKRFIIFATVLLAAACSKDDTKYPEGGSFNVEVSASHADTRTTLKDDVLGWSTSDALGIYAGDMQQNRNFTINSSCDKFYGVFLRTLGNQTTATYRAYFPYVSTNEGTTISTSLPTTQYGPWDSRADFMVADPITDSYSENPDKLPQLDFAFKASGHLFGVLKLTIRDGAKGELADEAISFIQINTPGTALAGDFKCDIAAQKPQAMFTSDADSVRLVFGSQNSASLSSEQTAYLVVRPAQIKNMTVTVTTTGGSAVFSSSQQFTVAPGTIKELPAITVSDKWERLPSLNERFSDKAFLTYMLSKFDQNKDGFLVENELKAVTSIDCSSMGIASLAGIELMENLASLICSGNPITKLSLNSNTRLRTLICTGTALSSLDIKGCTALESIDIGGTAIQSLDLQGCRSLKTFSADGCALKTLDLGGNTSVQEITLNNSATEKIVLSGCSSLMVLNCIADKLTSLDVSSCSALHTISCYDNSALSDINLKGCTALNGLWCRQCALSSLDIRDCESLQTIYCQRNKLKSLDTSKNPNLGFLYCHTNDFTSLDVSGNPVLSTLNCNSCPSLKTVYLATGQEIPSFTYDASVTTVRYK